jgi:hypothetical protein
MSESDSAAIANDMRKEMDKLLDKIKKSRREERGRMRCKSQILLASLRLFTYNCIAEMRDLKKELYQREDKAIKEMLSTSDVILATNVGAADRSIRDMTFDVVVIDEAAQALEAR